MILSRWALLCVCAAAMACSENGAAGGGTATGGTATAVTADAKVVTTVDAGQPSDTAVPTACKVSADCGTPSACQAYVCDPTLGCVATALPDGALCTPADTCAVGGVCASGACAAGKPKTCDDANPCTADQCSPAASGDGCVHTANTASCDDGDPCTDGDTCKDSQCQAGATSVCGCKTSADCVAKEDGNLCNGTWFCNKASGACQFNPATVVNCATVDDPACSKSLCDGKSGACAPVAIGDGKACDDGNPCTTGDACQAGQCASSANTCICKDDGECAGKDDGECAGKDDGECAGKDDGECAGKDDGECAGKDDGDLCNGVMFCNKASGKCEINPATVVVCQTALDTVCSKTALAFTAALAGLAGRHAVTVADWQVTGSSWPGFLDGYRGVVAGAAGYS